MTVGLGILGTKRMIVELTSLRSLPEAKAKKDFMASITSCTFKYRAFNEMKKKRLISCFCKGWKRLISSLRLSCPRHEDLFHVNKDNVPLSASSKSSRFFFFKKPPSIDTGDGGVLWGWSYINITFPKSIKKQNRSTQTNPILWSDRKQLIHCVFLFFCFVKMQKV